MNTDQDARLFRIYEQAMNKSGADRDAFLSQACAEAGISRAQVDAMLAAAEVSDHHLADGIAAGIADVMRSDRQFEPGDRIGAWRLDRLLGQGGMGRVFLATREDDVVMRAAIKVARGGPNEAGLIKRFKKERDILASLHHTYIAQLYDAGATEDGRPFFIMEYVQGSPIHHYCQTRRLSLEQRLDLFVKVCEAVSYAHRNLVLHRDIKPANILVTDAGQPKLLDFGISGLMKSDTNMVDTQTSVGMTPGYASPEQLDHRRLTAATDVWSLGVVLYHLLTGGLPYGIHNVSPMEFYRRIREDDITKPSTKAAAQPETAGDMRLTPTHLRRRLQGDLDTMIMHALEKSPDDRYPSVEALSADIRRYLKGLPVSAATPSATYRLSKFIRRNRAPLLVAGLFFCLLSGFTLITLKQQRQMERERNTARRERDTSRMVAEFLGETFKSANPNTARGEDVTALDLLNAGAARIDSELEDQAVVRANLMAVMGESYRALGRYNQAESLLKQALELSQKELGADHPDTIQRLFELGNLYKDTGRQDQAETILRQVLNARQKDQNDVAGLVHVLNSLGLVLAKKGDNREAEQRFRTAYSYRARVSNTLNAGTANNLGLLLKEIGDYPAAEPFLREALTLHRRAFPSPHPAIATSLNNLGLWAKETGDLNAASQFWRESLDMRRELYAPDHPKVLAGLNNLGALLKDQGNFKAAEPLFREVLAVKRERVPAGSPKLIVSLNNLAVLLVETGDLNEADALFTEAVDIVDQKLKAGHLFSQVLARNRALLRLSQNRPEEALSLAQSSVDGLRRTQKTGSLHLILAESILGGALNALGRYTEAEPLLVNNYQQLTASESGFPVHTRRMRTWLAALYQATDRPEKAAAYRD